MGPKTGLAKQEEDHICQWIIRKAKLGFPMNEIDVRDSVQQILNSLGRSKIFRIYIYIT